MKSLEKVFSHEADYRLPTNIEMATTEQWTGSSPFDHSSAAVKLLFSKYQWPENCDYLDVPHVAKCLVQ